MSVMTDCPCGGQVVHDSDGFGKPVERCVACGAAHPPVPLVAGRDRRNIRELARVVHGMAVRGELP